MKNLFIILLPFIVLVTSCKPDPIDLCSGDFSPARSEEISEYYDYTFQWCAIANAVKYRFVLDTMEDFHIPLVDSTVLATTYYHFLPYSQPNTNYYWKVYGISDTGTETLMFETDFKTRDNRGDFVGTFNVEKWAYTTGFLGNNRQFIKNTTLKVSIVGEHQLKVEDLETGDNRILNRSAENPRHFELKHRYIYKSSGDFKIIGDSLSVGMVTDDTSPGASRGFAYFGPR